MIFVTGYHHSGTSIMQHSLLLAFNISTPTRFGEEKPRSNTKLPVIKFPLYENTKRMDVMKEDIDKYADVVVYMTRDKPNTVWSVMKRTNQLTFASARQWSTDFCEKKAWWKAQYFRVPVIDIHLVNFTFSPDKVIKYIVRVYHDKIRDNFQNNTVHAGRRLKAAEFPRDVDHKALRIHQIHSNITTPDLNTYHKQCKDVEIVSELVKECFVSCAKK